jgi:hypothetical protein
MRWCGVVGSATRPSGRVKTHEARGQVAHAAGKSRAAMCAPAAGLPVSFHRLMEAEARRTLSYLLLVIARANWNQPSRV